MVSLIMLPCYNFLFVSHNLPCFVWICFLFIFHFWLLFWLLTSTSMGKEVGCIFFLSLLFDWVLRFIYLFFCFAFLFCLFWFVLSSVIFANACINVSYPFIFIFSFIPYLLLLPSYYHICTLFYATYHCGTNNWNFKL